MFLFDKKRCSGCGACIVACMDCRCEDLSARLPVYRRLRRDEGEKNGVPFVLFSMLACRHCRNPRCASACPTGAMAPDGAWVRVDPELCVGCGACVNACPFGAIAQSAEGRPEKCPGCAERVCEAACPTGAWRWADA